MSCHDIGHSLNSVIEVILEEFDKGNISYETAHKVIKQCRNAVNYCDGNSYEALECFEEQGRCTCCLEIKGDVMNVYDLPVDMQFLSDSLTFSSYGEKLLGGYICKACAFDFYNSKGE